MKIAVYGSLLEGLHNHHILKNDKTSLLKSEVVDLNYGMISYGGFPALVPSSDTHKITIEIYECDEDTYKRVERLEGYPSFYQKHKAQTSLGEVELYVIDKEREFKHQPDEIKVEDGNWRSFRVVKARNQYINGRY